MSDTPKPKAGKDDAPKPRTPEQDAKDAKAGRQAAEDAKAAENNALIDAGKVVPLGPITAYETERAKLGDPEAEVPEPTEPVKGDDK